MRQEQHPPCLQDSSSSPACDLMVLLPKESSGLQSQLMVKELMNRLAATGFTHMALTHTIYGRPRPEDRADKAIPESLWKVSLDKSTGKEPAGKKRKLDSGGNDKSSNSPIRVLRRLHAVVENQSDVGVYMANGPHADILNEYDIVSISPRNDKVFASVCKSASVADIITLDYTAGRGGLKLPYKIRSVDVKNAVARQVILEIPFAPALLHTKQRKALVQTSRELQMASMGVKNNLLLFSSGDRTFDEADMGAMALRTPGDLINLMSAVLRFDPKTSHDAVGASGMTVIKRAKQRRFGSSDIVDVFFQNNTKETVESRQPDSSTELTKETPLSVENKDDDDDSSHDGIDDGYIAM
jgi:RNase P/RNase MRP subunit p30